jgi:RNA-directed DNA polymerase
MSDFWDLILERLGLKQRTPAPPPPERAADPRAARGEDQLRRWREGDPGEAPLPPGASPAGDNPFINTEILGLGAEDWAETVAGLRGGAWRLPWTLRRGVIPSQQDPRTALIDRGMVLRGLLTEEELVEMHRVGDAWAHYQRGIWAARIYAAGDAEAAVAALRSERAERRARLRAEAAERRRARAEAVARRRETDIIFAGRGVSSRLWDRRADVEKLTAAGLPVLCSPADLAACLEIEVPALRWLCFHAEAVTHPHYVRFTVPKRAGGERTLLAPLPALAAAQRRVLRGILDRVPPEDCAHGFVAGRSTVSGALPHVGRDVLVKLDLKDFFPTITFPRVRGLFASLGYSPAVATLLALLACEPPRRLVEYEGRRYYVAVGDPALPQGAPTSPALSNLVCRRLDRRLRGGAAAKGWTYTRYADDLTFSAPPGRRGDIGWILGRARRVIEEEGFTLHPGKVRVLRRSQRQSVTGVGVNDKPGLPRAEVRRLRAILHNAARDGLAAQNREGRPDFEAWLRGKLAYLAMVDPDRGRTLLADLDALRIQQTEG